MRINVKLTKANWIFLQKRIGNGNDNKTASDVLNDCLDILRTDNVRSLEDENNSSLLKSNI